MKTLGKLISEIVLDFEAHRAQKSKERDKAKTREMDARREAALAPPDDDDTTSRLKHSHPIGSRFFLHPNDTDDYFDEPGYYRVTKHTFVRGIKPEPIPAYKLEQYADENGQPLRGFIRPTVATIGDEHIGKQFKKFGLKVVKEDEDKFNYDDNKPPVWTPPPTPPKPPYKDDGDDDDGPWNHPTALHIVNGDGVSKAITAAYQHREDTHYGHAELDKAHEENNEFADGHLHVEETTPVRAVITSDNMPYEESPGFHTHGPGYLKHMYSYDLGDWTVDHFHHTRSRHE